MTSIVFALKTISNQLWALGKKESFARFSGLIIFVLAILTTIPSFFVPLGLPPEADAVDYRIPIIKWILRHGSYPNWPWSYVDDFPMLAELIMAPFYAISPGLARIVPLSFHLLAGISAGGICNSLMKEIFPDRKFRPSTWILLAGAWIVCLRPLAIQINIFLTDTAATALALLSIWMVLENRIKLAGLGMGLCLATKYFMWPLSVGIFALVVYRAENRSRFRSILDFSGIAAVFILPLLIRNYLVNAGNPFFPLFENIFRPSGENLEPWLDGYGRGKTLLDLFLFPFDLVYTNSFVKSFYDYTVGKSFLTHLTIFLFLILMGGKEARLKISAFFKSRSVKAILLLIAFNTLIWFFSSQQLRFYALPLALMEVLFFIVISQLRRNWIVWITLLNCFSLLSIQKDSILIGIGLRPNQFQDDYLKAKTCFDRVPNLYSSIVGYTGRDNTLGYFDFDFRFVGWHVYGIAREQFSEGKPNFVFGTLDNSKFVGYVPWPIENPCLLALQSTNEPQSRSP